MTTKNVLYLTSWEFNDIISQHKHVIKDMGLKENDYTIGESYVKGGKALCCMSGIKDFEKETYTMIKTYLDDNNCINTQINTIEDFLPF